MKRKRQVHFYHIRLKDFLKRIMVGIIIAGVLFICLKGPFLKSDTEILKKFEGFTLGEDLIAKGSLPFLYHRVEDGNFLQEESDAAKEVFLHSLFPVYGSKLSYLTYINSFSQKFNEEIIQFEQEENKETTAEEEMPEGAQKIENVTLVADTKEGGYLCYEDILLNNKTSFDIDISSLLQAKLPYQYKKGETQVLIVHTHTTESYAKEGATFYTDEDTDRSQNPDESVVAVGDVITEKLQSLGIGVIHDTTVHDYPSFTGSYSNAEETIQKNISEHPGIVIVLDIHRDALITSEGVKYRPIVTNESKDYAQLMLVMGTNEGGLEFDQWEDNLKTALRVQKGLEEAVPGIVRPIYLKPQRYNEHLSPGSMLIEVGGCGNYLSDAKNSAEVIAKVVAQVLKGA